MGVVLQGEMRENNWRVKIFWEFFYLRKLLNHVSNNITEITFTNWKDILSITPEFEGSFVFKGEALSEFPEDTAWQSYLRSDNNYSKLFTSFDKIYPSELLLSKSAAFVEYILNRVQMI